MLVVEKVYKIRGQKGREENNNKKKQEKNKIIEGFTYPECSKKLLCENKGEILNKINNPLELKKENIYKKKLESKISKGLKLTRTQMNYLKKNNKELYKKVFKIQRKRAGLNYKLRSCKSKAEVQDIILTIWDQEKETPEKGLLEAAFQNIIEEFKESLEYKKLPENKDCLIEEKRQKIEIIKKEKSKTGKLNYQIGLKNYEQIYIEELLPKSNFNKIQ